MLKRKVKEPSAKPRIGPYLERIAQIIEEDNALPEKQRHTAKRIYERIREMGYENKCTEVKKAVRELERVRGEVFVPLIHRPMEAQVAFCYALVKISGELIRVEFFVMVLPHSDAFFVMAKVGKSCFIHRVRRAETA